jgi:hypothetical protein
VETIAQQLGIGPPKAAIVAIVAADIADLYQPTEVDLPAEMGLGESSCLVFNSLPIKGEQLSTLLYGKG